MGTNKSKPVNQNNNSSHHHDDSSQIVVPLFGSTNSGKTVFLKSIADYCRINIYKDYENLDKLVELVCRTALSNILDTMKIEERREIFLPDPNDDPQIRDLKLVLSETSSSNVYWISLLEQFSDNYLVYGKLWFSLQKLREFVKERSEEYYLLTHISNYDRFFNEILNGKKTIHLLKYIPRERIPELKFKIKNQEFSIVDPRRKFPRSSKKRVQMWIDLIDRAKFGIFLASLVNFDKTIFNEDTLEIDESIQLFRQTIGNSFAKKLRFVVIFTKADLFIEKLRNSKFELKPPKFDRNELREIGNIYGERDAINSIIDLYQFAFEQERPNGNEIFQYHIVNNLSDIECYESFVESNEMNLNSKGKTFVSKSLILKDHFKLHKMVGELKLADVRIETNL